MAEVAVIIPFHPSTGDVRLDRAISSIQNQSVDTEIIVVEDTDGRGPAWARNRGMEKAECKFIAFCDADDVWKNSKLDRQLEELRSTDSQIVFEGDPNQDNVIEQILFGDLNSFISSMILVDEVAQNLRFNEEIPRREDHLFAIQAVLIADSASLLQDLIVVHKHESGLSTDTDLWMRADSNEIMARELDGAVADDYIVNLKRLAHYQRGRAAHFDGEYSIAVSELSCSIRHKWILPVPALLLTIIHIFSPIHPRSTNKDLLTKLANTFRAIW